MVLCPGAPFQGVIASLGQVPEELSRGPWRLSISRFRLTHCKVSMSTQLAIFLSSCDALLFPTGSLTAEIGVRLSDIAKR